jgi:hypothetical protein
MLPSALILPAGGSVDGVNRVFTTPSKYIPRSLQVFVNGMNPIKTGTEDGWKELAPYTKFELRTAPVEGDVVSVYYRRWL